MSKLGIKNIGANVFEFMGMGLQIAAEITIFVSGMGFFIAPLLKKMYAELLGKNLHYSVAGSGDLCLDNLDQIRPLFNSSALVALNPDINFESKESYCVHKGEQLIFSNNILFDLPFPKSLFAASVLVCGLGCTALMIASLLVRYGASLHPVYNEMPPDERLVAEAKRMNNTVASAGLILLIGSRLMAIYATTTISMTQTLRNVAGILGDFSIPSATEIKVDSNTLGLTTQFKNRPSFNVMTMTMHFITTLDFSELRHAAANGSKKIDSYDYYIGLGAAVIALVLGHMALKVRQKSDFYADILLRHKYTQQLLKTRRSSVMLTDLGLHVNRESQHDFSVTNPNRLFVEVISPLDTSVGIDIDEHEDRNQANYPEHVFLLNRPPEIL